MLKQPRQIQADDCLQKLVILFIPFGMLPERKVLLRNRLVRSRVPSCGDIEPDNLVCCNINFASFGIKLLLENEGGIVPEYCALPATTKHQYQGYSTGLM